MQVYLYALPPKWQCVIVVTLNILCLYNSYIFYTNAFISLLVIHKYLIILKIIKIKKRFGICKIIILLGVYQFSIERTLGDIFDNLKYSYTFSISINRGAIIFIGERYKQAGSEPSY